MNNVNVAIITWIINMNMNVHANISDNINY